MAHVEQHLNQDNRGGSMGTIATREENKQTHIYLDALAPTVLCHAPRAREASDPPRGTSIVTPYDTGKVKIGLAYQRKVNYATDVYLQRALLEKSADRQHITAIAVVMAAVFMAAVAMILAYA